jgi:16S rRNA (uracil1498-N3)-methyltransferase
MTRRPEGISRFRVEPGALERPEVELRGAALHHLRTVVRLRAGDHVELFDGAGVGASAEIVRLTAAAAELRVLERIGGDRESPLELTLAVALARGAKLDWVIEKATELGVRRILPFITDRSMRRGEKTERWRRIAESAAAQSGRVVVPEISAVVNFDAVLADGARQDRKLLLWERASATPAAGARPRRALVVTGSEGGFSAAEAERATAAGFDLVGLGPRVLRAETAAITAVSVCQMLWGDLAG